MARHAYVGVAAQSTANMLCCRAKAQSPCHDHVARQLLERNQRQGVLVALRGSETVLMHKGSGVWQWGEVTKLAADLRSGNGVGPSQRVLDYSTSVFENSTPCAGFLRDGFV